MQPNRSVRVMVAKQCKKGKVEEVDMVKGKMPVTIVDSAMLIQFAYKRALTKVELLRIVSKAFPGAVQREKAKDASSKLPPGVSIDAGSLNFFFASDKCVVRFKGLPMSDRFLDVAITNLKRWFAVCRPERVLALSYRESHYFPLQGFKGDVHELLVNLPSDISGDETNSCMAFRYQDTRYVKQSNAYANLDRSYNVQTQGMTYVITVTRPKNGALTRCYEQELEELRKEARRLYFKSLGAKGKELNNERIP